MTIRRAKGTGGVRKVGDKYYFRIKINGKEIVRRMPKAIDDKTADIEATRLYTIASAKTKEEVALFAGQAREVIKNNQSIPVVKAFAKFLKSPNRPECNDKTMAAHARAWESFLEYLYNSKPNIKMLNEVEEQDAESWAEQLKKKPRTYNTYIGSCSLIIRSLQRQSGLKFS